MHLKPRTPAGKLLAVSIAVIVTALLALIVANFSGGEKDIKHDVARLYSTRDPQFQQTLGLMLGPPIIGGNRFQALRNGDQIFPTMLQAIEEAKQTVCFETYIYWAGDIGRRFAEAFAKKARSGVKVHVLLDWVGSSKMDQTYLSQMQEAGVDVHYYHPLRWYNVGRLNNRTHRKLLVVDGRVGFTGGVGIAPEWTGNAQDPAHWRDSHFRVEGPAAGQMQSVFMDNWTKTTGAVLHGSAYFPHVDPVGDGRAQVFSSSPNGGSESMQLMYLLAITSAEKTIDVSASYFVPDEITLHALTAAMKRGVRLRMITPGPHMDADAVRRASRGLWGDLLRAGAEMYEYQPTMYHCKVVIVDGLLVSVGSTNLDDRSLRLNDEANLNIYDAAFAQEQTAYFEQDLQRSRRITYAQWQSRALKEKLHERIASWLQPVL